MDISTGGSVVADFEYETPILQFTSTTLQMFWWKLVVAMSISKMASFLLHLLFPEPGSCEGHLLLDLRAGLCLLTVLGVVAINEPGLSLLFLQREWH